MSNTTGQRQAYLIISNRHKQLFALATVEQNICRLQDWIRKETEFLLVSAHLRSLLLDCWSASMQSTWTAGMQRTFHPVIRCR